MAIGRMWRVCAAGALLVACGSSGPQAQPTPSPAAQSPATQSPSPSASPVDGAGAASSAPACGVERWSVKTLTDPGAADIRATVKPTTVTALRKLKPPEHIQNSMPRLEGVETTIYRIRVRLRDAKLERDKDIHLVVADPKTGRTMIVEFPDLACARRASAAHRAKMSAARKAFVAKCGLPSKSSFVGLKGTATIEGVGFFDKLHRQRGLAPNGIELHPVFSFKATSCTRV